MKNVSQSWDGLWFSIFDSEPVILSMPPDEEKLSEHSYRLFGRMLNDADYLELVGAQPGNSIRPRVLSDPDEPDHKILGIELNGTVLVEKANRFVSFKHFVTVGDRPTKPSLAIGLIEVDSVGQKNGIATHLLARQVFCARHFGFSVIEGLADNAQGRVGYIVFPRLGFDRELLQKDKDRLPEQYAEMSNLSELIASQDGLDWWKDNGWRIQVEFDTTPGSASVRSLAAVFAEKGWIFEDRPYVLPSIVRNTVTRRNSDA